MPLYRMAGSGQLPPPLPPQRYIAGQHAYNQQSVVSPFTVKIPGYVFSLICAFQM